ncbi:gliding motility-associated C-terminal domain-containing protein [Cytophaga aurantiaca]|uniref:gliding motility-associated C-terminal domain-containing protein n=1 Tax=Cytophaga aurantiaca TaxID=29530 RepID=UPI0003A3571B|nr:gliding motility-associated C-terminal domain-containing protein [Cytophaga aurantiaca]
MQIGKFYIRILLVLILITSFSQFIFAQKESNNWYFGNNAGITFNTSPPSALTDGALTAREGCASISDENGNLLFYSNGINVWNKNHVIMDNGSGLEGSDYSTQSSLIVKLPGSTNLFYIFTVPDQQDIGAYKYSIVDLSFNAGLGKVITKNLPLLKDVTDPNSAFTNLSTEALTAGYHTNQTDVWIVVHEYNVTKFYSYLLTPSGLQQPVVSNTGNQKSYLGQCRISPNGKRIAVGGYFATGVDLFDFNSETGIISNAQALIGTLNALDHRIYGLSFSPNSNLLYITDATANIYQFDLTQSTTADIINSKKVIGHGTGNQYPQIQLGPDKKIYVAQNGKTFLGVIESPDIIGTSCTFVDNGISLNGRMSTLGLPTFMVNYVTLRPPVVSLGNDTTLCPSATIILDAGNNQGATFLWNTQAQTQTITITSAGKYYVDVTRDNIKTSDTIIVSYISFDPLNIPTSYEYCADTDPSLQLNPAFTETQFIWQDGSTTHLYSITQAGVYWLERYNQNCSIRNEFTVTNNCSVEMIIPNLITPNKDGLNDVFAIKNLPIPNWSLEIYNRWGALVYRAEEYKNDWGNHNVSDGVYYYQLKHRFNGTTHKGWVEVLGAVK